MFGEIALRATARAAEPLLLILDVEKPGSPISPSTSRRNRCAPRWCASWAGVDAEIKRFIAAHVAGEIDSPQSQKAKIIDVAEQPRCLMDRYLTGCYFSRVNWLTSM